MGRKYLWELLDRQTQSFELGVKPRRSEKSNTIRLATIGSQQGQISCVVAAGKEYMFALVIIGKQAEHLCEE
jgi:hypothetical protein